MKVSDMRKALKIATVKPYFETGNYGIVKGYLHIDVPSNFEGCSPESLLTVEAQANDLTYKGDLCPTLKDTRANLKVWNLRCVSGFYAAEVRTKHTYAFGSHGYDSPERAECFWNVVKATVEKYNLRHVYPDCELSQITAALEKLGATIALAKINRSEDLHAFNQHRPIKVEE